MGMGMGGGEGEVIFRKQRLRRLKTVQKRLSTSVLLDVDISLNIYNNALNQQRHTGKIFFNVYY